MPSRPLLLFGLLLAAGCSRPVSEPPAAAAPPASSPTAGADRAVRIDNFAFGPADLEVNVGDRVVWTNADDVPHTVTSDAKPRELDSGTIDTDGVYRHVFTRPGTYPYFCAVHPKMTGKIVVK